MNDKEKLSSLREVYTKVISDTLHSGSSKNKVLLTLPTIDSDIMIRVRPEYKSLTSVTGPKSRLHYCGSIQLSMVKGKLNNKFHSSTKTSDMMGYFFSRLYPDMSLQNPVSIAESVMSELLFALDQDQIIHFLISIHSIPL